MTVLLSSAVTTSGPGGTASPAERVGRHGDATHRGLDGYRVQPDLIRVVALALVVVIHASPWPEQRAGPGFYPALALLARPSVPLFVILSGLLLAPRRTQPSRDGGFWSRRLGRTLVPWLPWALVYFLVDVKFTRMAPGFGASWGWWVGGAGHLYFLLLIPQLYLLLVLWPRSRRGQNLALVAAIVVQVGVQVLRVTANLPGPGNTILLSFGYELAPFWMGYFAIGLWLGSHMERLDRFRPTLALCLAALVATGALLFWDPLSIIARHWGPWVDGTGAFLTPPLLLFTLAVFVPLWRMGDWLARQAAVAIRAVCSVSRHALGIYIIHPMLLLAIGSGLQRAPGLLSLEQPWPVNLLPFCLLIALALGGGWLATRALVGFRVFAWTVGETYRSQL